MKGLIFTFGLLVILASCTAKVDPKDLPPKELIAKPKMAQALVSLHLHSVAGQNIYKSQVITKPMAVKTGAYVLDSLGIDTAAFRTSFDYYRDHPAQMKEIYLMAKDTISVRISEVDAQK